MVFKILNKKLWINVQVPNSQNKKGYTLVELTVVLGIIIVLAAALLLRISPDISIKRGHDNKRISDLSTLETAIISYKIDNEVWPDTIDTLRVSYTLPTGNSGPLENPADGWIDADLSPYFQKLLLDPVNDATYHYSYMHNGRHYELNAVLENQLELGQNDGGDDANVYEVGDDLSVL